MGRTAKCPEPLCRERGVTGSRVMSCITSEGVTPPSSLLQAHVPIPNPPAGCSPRSAGLWSVLTQVGDDPRLYLCARYNLARYLTEDGQYREAADLLALDEASTGRRGQILLSASERRSRVDRREQERLLACLKTI